MSLDLPPEFQSVLEAVGSQRPEVRAMFRYALVLMMIDDENARVIGTRIEDGHEFVQVRTIAGDEFEIERPAMSDETERFLLEQIREIVEDEQGG